MRLVRSAESRLARADRFVGREQELAALSGAIDEVRTGHGRLILVSGEPGIGKTRLAIECAALASELGIRVAWGRWWESSGVPAYWPWVQVICSLHETPSRERFRVPESPTPHELASLVPDLAPDSPVNVSDNVKQRRFLLFDAVSLLLKDFARSDPILLVLDDLHDADQASLQLLRFIARNLASTAILLIGTYRDAEV
jgi:eukaryotic-like serine/threonine-protein kinase